MRRYVYFFRQLLIANVAVTLTHRTDFLNSVVSALLWGAFSIFAVFVLTGRSRQIAGLSQVEVMLLVLTYMLIVGLFHLFFSRNFPKAAYIIHHGELDLFLLKPMHPLILLCIQEFNIAQVVRGLVSLGLITGLVQRSEILVHPGSVLAFCALSVVGVALLVGIHLLFLIVLLQNSYLSNIMEFGSLLVASARYPMETLRYAPPLAVLLYLPVMAVVNIPTRVLIGKSNLLEVLLFVGFSFILVTASIWGWNRSLIRYTGASG